MDDRVTHLGICVLGVIGCLCVCGIVGLEAAGVPAPMPLGTIGGAAVGGILGIIVPAGRTVSVGGSDRGQSGS